MRQSNPCLLSSFRFLSKFGSVLVILTGWTVLGGLALNAAWLESPLWRLKPITALTLVLGGLSLLLLPAAIEGGRPRRRRWGMLFALLMSLSGLVSLVGRYGGFGGGSSSWLLLRQLKAISAQPVGWTGTATACCFVLLGLVLWRLHAKAAAQFIDVLLSIPPLLLATLGVMDGIFDFSVSTLRMPLTSALTLLVLTVSILFARPDDGVMSIISTDSSGGLLARRLLPAAFVLSLCLGWLRFRGERAGYFGTELGIALFTSAEIVILSALILGLAQSLDRRDSEVMRAGDEAIRQRLHATHLISQLTQANAVLQDEVRRLRKTED